MSDDPAWVAMQDQREAAARDTSDVLRQSTESFTEGLTIDQLVATPFGAVAVSLYSSWTRHGCYTCAHLTAPTSGATLFPVTTPPRLLCPGCAHQMLTYLCDNVQQQGRCDICGQQDLDDFHARYCQLGEVLMLFGVCGRCARLVTTPPLE